MLIISVEIMKAIGQRELQQTTTKKTKQTDKKEQREQKL